MSTFSELIDFTRSSTGTYLDSVVYGEDKANAFAGSGGNDWTVVDKNTVTATEPSALSYFTGIVSGLTIGAQYKIVLTITNYAGTNNLGMGSAGGVGSSVRLASNGTVTLFFTATAVSLDAYVRTNSSGTINVSVVEVTSTAGGTPLLRTADTNEPRLEYDASGQPLGLLIEEQRTNAMLNSGSITNWSKTNVTMTESVAVAPDGTVTADKAQRTDPNTNADYRQTRAVTVGNDYTFSLFAKSDTSTRLELDVSDSRFSSNDWARFNVATGTIYETGTGATYSITDYGNGWYRFSLTATCTASGNSAVIVRVISNEPHYAWGGQFEQGSFPTSYIPTSGSTVTRAKDVCSLPLERYHHNAQSYTMYAEFQSSPKVPSDFERVWNLSNDDTSPDYVQLQYNTSNAMQVYSRYNSGANGNISPIEVTDTTNKVALKVDGTVMRSACNGVLQSGTLSNEIEDFTKLTIGASDGSTLQLNSHIKVIQSYAKGLTDAQLIDLTEPSSSPTMSLTFDGQATSELVEGLHD